MDTRSGTVNADVLNVRPVPNAAGNEPVGKLRRGAQVKITGEEGGWYGIEAGELRGFVSKDYISLPRPRIGHVTATLLNVRAQPSAEGNEPLGSLARGSKVEVVDRHGDWYHINYEDGEAYVLGEYISIEDSEPASSYLFEDEALVAAPLAPSEDDRIAGGENRRERLVAETWNENGGLLRQLSQVVDIHPASAVAVLCVESSGRGFADGTDGPRMIIRFENHIFWRYWGKENADTFNAHFRYDPEARWKGHQYREDAGGEWADFHGNQDGEWKVLQLARGLDERAALFSISMGAPQIMGFNASRIGYDTVAHMFDAFSRDIRYHILGLFDFVRGQGTTSPMIQALQEENFEAFATHYNGSGQAAQYGDWIRGYYELATDQGIG